MADGGGCWVVVLVVVLEVNVAGGGADCWHSNWLALLLADGGGFWVVVLVALEAVLAAGGIAS